VRQIELALERLRWLPHIGDKPVRGGQHPDVPAVGLGYDSARWHTVVPDGRDCWTCAQHPNSDVRRREDPVALAEWVLNEQPEWTRERILAEMNGHQPRRVDLTRPIQVIAYYITAVVMPEDGAIHFAEDIYGHDTRLDRALTRRRLSQ
jgi:murein L,D-transpeptidase YcbB/YkuD